MMLDTLPRLAACTLALLLTLTSVAIASPRHDRVEREVVSALSQARARHGLSRLRSASALDRVADRHSRAMAHTGRLDHGLWLQRVERAVPNGPMGETIGMMHGRARALVHHVVDGWLASPPHRAIILDPRMRRVGLARQAGHSAWFFTADFTRWAPR